ncbi:hypothetical protein TNCV_3585111 [Trichonephila clavipes]|nr:hypothetical protein TNCV_3585111 [Trichonephila clavipes]
MSDIKIDHNGLFEEERRLNVHLNSNKLEQSENQHVEKMRLQRECDDGKHDPSSTLIRVTDRKPGNPNLQPCLKVMHLRFRSMDQLVEAERKVRVEFDNDYVQCSADPLSFASS